MASGQLAVLAIGGNALIRDREHESIPDQYEMVARFAVDIAGIEGRDRNARRRGMIDGGAIPGSAARPVRGAHGPSGDTTPGRDAKGDHGVEHRQRRA